MTIDFSNPAHIFAVCFVYLFISVGHFVAGVNTSDGGNALAGLLGFVGLFPLFTCIVTFVMILIDAI